MSANLVFHPVSVSATARASLKGQKPVAIWFTGLSGTGKSTIANALEQTLVERGKHTYLLDGDNLRLGLCRDLGFSNADRQENIRRVAEVARLFVDAGMLVITAFISPFQRDREIARELIGEENFIEVFIDTPLEECERRDPKGLYRKARSGLIVNFTGVGSVYEPPLNPHVHIRTLENDVPAVVAQLVDYLLAKDFLI
jgi:adenylylsulfate kinase